MEFCEAIIVPIVQDDGAFATPRITVGIAAVTIEPENQLPSGIILPERYVLRDYFVRQWHLN